MRKEFIIENFGQVLGSDSSYESLAELIKDFDLELKTIEIL